MINHDHLRIDGPVGAGLTGELVLSGLERAYATLETIDQALLASFDVRLSDVVEGANFSSIVGNLLTLGVVEASDGRFRQAGAHKYQDLRAVAAGCKNIEVKVALERNDPKGHLAKPGWYLTCRYVFVDGEEKYSPHHDARHSIPRVWEIRVGELSPEDFSVSNTPGDSGKTANIRKSAQRRLSLVYFVPHLCPYKSGAEWYLDRYG